MKFCKIGIHRYVSMKTQTVQNVVGGFSETQLQREVLVCSCDKTKYVGFEVALLEALKLIKL